MEYTVHTGGACFIITRLLASPVQSFLLKAMDFSLVFLFLQSDLSNCTISAISGLSDMVAEGVEQAASN